jgi:hypothetical protein
LWLAVGGSGNVVDHRDRLIDRLYPRWWRSNASTGQNERCPGSREQQRKRAVAFSFGSECDSVPSVICRNCRHTDAFGKQLLHSLAAPHRNAKHGGYFPSRKQRQNLGCFTIA